MGPLCPPTNSILSRTPIVDPLSYFLFQAAQGTRFCSVVEHLFVLRWVVGSIPNGGPIELFLSSSSAGVNKKKRPRYVLSGLWDSIYKSTLAANRKKR